MKRSFINLFAIVIILASLVGSGMQAQSAYALGATTDFVPDPTGWSTVQLFGAWGIGSTVYAVGSGVASNVTQPLIYHGIGNNGTGWSSSNSPTKPAGWNSGSLAAVWGSGATNIYAVGKGDNSISVKNPLIYHSTNGTSWSYEAIDLSAGGWTSGGLESVWGSASSNVYVAGWGTSSGSTKPLVYHYDTSWGPISLPDSGLTSPRLFGIWVASTGEVYAAGWGNSGGVTVPLLYRKVGTSWFATSPALPSSTWTSGELEAIWGTSANDVYAVGSGANAGTTMPLIYHFDGTNWSAAAPSLPATTGWTDGQLYGIWGNGSAVYAVGSGNGNSLPLLYRKTSHTNSGWAAFSPKFTGWTSGYYDGVWGMDTLDVYAVGTGSNGALISRAVSDGTVPSAVAGIKAVSGLANGTVALSWTAPFDDYDNSNSGPVDSYIIRYSDKLTDLVDCTTGGSSFPTGTIMSTTPGGTQRVTVSGLIAGTKYYFRICAVDEESNKSAFVDANAFAGPPPVGAGTYDDTHPNWIYTGSWQTVSTPSAYGGTLHYSTDNASPATAAFLFTGSGFTVRYVQYINRGNIQVWIDGVQVDTIHAYSDTLAWQVAYTRNGLTNETHKVEFKHGGPGGNLIDIDSIQVLVPAGAGIYDDTSQYWSYAGAWGTVSVPDAYGGTLHYSLDTSTPASASFTFTGIGFSLKYVRYINRGDIQVWLDGVQVDTIHASSSTLGWQVAYTKGKLANTTHTVVFKHGGPGGNLLIDIDSIQVLVPAGVGIYDDTSPFWNYSGTWGAASVPDAYGGTFHYSTDTTTPGTASFAFTGVGFVLKYVQFVNRGDIRVVIDDVPVDTIHATSSTLGWQVMYVKSGLPNGTHTVEFKHAGPSPAYLIDIDSIQVLVPAGADIYDDTHPNWNFTGTWGFVSVPDAAGGTLHYSTDPAATAAFTFTGVGFRLKYVQYINRGDIQVWVDNVQVDTIHANSSTLGWQVAYTKMLSTNDTHVVEFKYGGPAGSLIDIDSIQIIVPVGAGIYDDTNPGWIYSGTWGAVSIPDAYGGSIHYSADNSSPGAAAFAFTGTGFIFKYVRYINRGDIQVWIDGVRVDTIHAYSDTLGWQVGYTKSGLVNGSHIVEFKNGGPAGRLIDIDSIQILFPVGAGIYDDSSPNWIYTGSWATVSVPDAYGGTLHYSTDTSFPGTAAFTFTGTGFLLKYVQYINRGNIQVVIDNVPVDTIHAYGSTLGWQVTYIKSGLTNATHVVEFKHGGPVGNLIDIDSIQVLVPVGPGVYDDTHPSWTYSGIWGYVPIADAYGGTLHYTTDLNATASFTFTGTGYSLKYVQYINRGNIQVWVNDTLLEIINAYSGTLGWQATYTRTGLPYDTYTIVFKHGGPGGTLIDIDSIEVIP